MESEHNTITKEFSASKAFESLKLAFMCAPILVHDDLAKPFIMEADASDFALGSILSQMGDDDKLHPVAFHSRKFEVHLCCR